MADDGEMFAPLPAPLPPKAGGKVPSGAAVKGWEPIPIPDNPSVEFPKERRDKPTEHWRYYGTAGELLMMTVRFDRADGGKDILPLTWCRNRATGQKAWRYQSLPAPRPLFGLDRLAKKPAAPVLVVEGEKTAVAAIALFPDLVAVTSPAGAKSAAKADWSPLKARAVMIWPDNDDPGRTYADEVARLCRKAGAAWVRIIDVPRDWPDGWDLADPLPPAVTKADVLRLVNHIPPDTPQQAAESPAPEGDASPDPLSFRKFEMSERGLFYRPEEGQPQFLSGPFKVVAHTRDKTSDDWGLLLEWADGDGVSHRWPLPMALLAGDGSEVRRRLMGAGVRMAPGTGARGKFLEYLSAVEVPTRARCVDRHGWHGATYVTADRAYGQADAEPVLFQDEAMPEPVKRRGTFDGWQTEVAALAIGNSRLAFAISAGFAGPLLYWAGQDGGGFHFSGRSSTGKSTALYAAESIWREPKPRSWRVTDNGLEAIAAGANDGLLCLDELGQVDPRTAELSTYMLGNGSGKARARRDGSPRPGVQWRVVYLSTGEIGLEAKLTEDRRTLRAGQAVRFVEIPADAGAGFGAWESLHGSSDGAAFSVRVRRGAETHCGHAADAFLDQLAAQASDGEGLTGSVRAIIERWVSAHCPPGADGQVTRVAARFALVAAAGEIATRMGVLPWPEGEAARAAARCFGDWMACRGGVGSQEAMAMVHRVSGFLQRFGSSRFETEGENSAYRIQDRLGWRSMNDPLDGTWEYFVTAAGFKEMTRGFDRKAAVEALTNAGLLKTYNGLPYVKKNIKYYGSMNVYHFTIVAAGEGEEAT